jgi:synaptojanin
MHLYLRENPRTLYIVTSSQEENNGRPRRALVFRAAEDNPYQAVVEFLPKDQVNLSNSIRLTSRVVKGCLGLICVTDGVSKHPLRSSWSSETYPQISSLPL